MRVVSKGEQVRIDELSLQGIIVQQTSDGWWEWYRENGTYDSQLFDTLSDCLADADLET